MDVFFGSYRLKVWDWLYGFIWKICIKLVKSDSEDIYIVAKLLLNLLIEESWKT